MFCARVPSRSVLLFPVKNLLYLMTCVQRPNEKPCTYWLSLEINRKCLPNTQERGGGSSTLNAGSLRRRARPLRRTNGHDDGTHGCAELTRAFSSS